jgi:dihydroneopterin aldolase
MRHQPVLPVKGERYPWYARRSRAMGLIFLHRIRFEGVHGAAAPERALSRRFEVDLEIETSTAAAERTDRLSDTADYAVAAQLIVEIGTGPPHHLLESLARTMLDAVGARFPGARIRLDLRKLAPPGCPGSPDWAAVRLTHPAE